MVPITMVEAPGQHMGLKVSIWLNALEGSLDEYS